MFKKSMSFGSPSPVTRLHGVLRQRKQKLENTRSFEEDLIREMKHHLVEENYEFIKAVEQFKNTPSNDRAYLFNEIHHDFIDWTGPKALNLDFEVVQRIQDAYDNQCYNDDVFDEAAYYAQSIVNSWKLKLSK